jgi:iron complex outermembrane receptor protein
VVFNSPANGGLFGDFSSRLDYYNIKIKNVISPVPGLSVLNKCYNLDGSNPSYSATNEYCQLINRDATGQITTVTTPYLNLGAVETDGVEVQMHWGVPARFPGPIQQALCRFSAIGWLNNLQGPAAAGRQLPRLYRHQQRRRQPNSVPPRATPKWKALTTFGYRSDVGGLGLRWRYQGALKDNSVRADTQQRAASREGL